MPVLTADTLRNTYLRDMQFADEHGRPLPAVVIESKAKSVEAAFQRRYGMRLSPTVVRMGDLTLPGTPVRPDLPRKFVDAQPYDPRSFEGDRFVSLDLPIGPVKGRPRVFLQLPGSRPIEWSKEWVQVRKRARVLQLYPMGQTVNLMPLQATSLGFMALMGGRTIPNAWQIEYEAGYTEDDLAGEDADVLNALGMLTAIAVMIPGSIDLFAAKGIAGLSAGVDGLSNSTQLAGGGQALRYAPIIQAYKDELTSWERMYQHRGVGMRLAVL
ncbi:hypothetical protein [Deinococcus sp. UR1]|uniref:hypothetical protein n=1 Tax=Deinococcus sp. UR1 TaxID=1704277 RepID=UPI001F534942|nr:hypothetical protein [Deinococcus sp. UR1]